MDISIYINGIILLLSQGPVSVPFIILFRQFSNVGSTYYNISILTHHIISRYNLQLILYFLYFFNIPPSASHITQQKE